MNTRSLVVAGAVALTALGCQEEPTAPPAETTPRAESAARPLEGWFHIVWVDPAPGYGPAMVRYELVDERGHGTELDLDPGWPPGGEGHAGSIGERSGSMGTPSPVGGSASARSSPSPGLPVLGRLQYRSARIPMSRSSASSPTLRTSPKRCATYTALDSGHLLPWTRPLLARGFVQSDERHQKHSGRVVHLATADVILLQPGSLGSKQSYGDCIGAADADVDFPQF